MQSPCAVKTKKRIATIFTMDLEEILQEGSNIADMYLVQPQCLLASKKHKQIKYHLDMHC